MSDDNKLAVQLTVQQIVQRLIGPISPVGETNEDTRRFANLVSMINLVDRLTFDIGQVCNEPGTNMASIKQAANRARQFLRDLRASLDEDDLKELI